MVGGERRGRDKGCARVSTAQVGRRGTMRAGTSHPPRRQDRTARKYFMFEAASQGCVECVKHYLEVEGVDTASESDTMHYTVLDWAEWANSREVPGAADVVAYVRAFTLSASVESRAAPAME